MSQLILPIGERDHVQGLASAPVTLLEYGDYECPHCHEAQRVVKDLLKWFGNHLRFVFRHFPLAETHPHAGRAAEAAEAAGTQGRFWQMHEELFEHQQLLDDIYLEQYAGKIGLDVKRFTDELRAGVYAARVQQDYSSGVESGVKAFRRAAEAAVRDASPHEHNRFKVELTKRTLVRALSTVAGNGGRA